MLASITSDNEMNKTLGVKTLSNDHNLKSRTQHYFFRATIFNKKKTHRKKTHLFPFRSQTDSGFYSSATPTIMVTPTTRFIINCLRGYTIEHGSVILAYLIMEFSIFLFNAKTKMIILA